MTLSHKEIFERYVYAGALTGNADAVAEMFTEDGWYEAPLVPVGHPLRGPLHGRASIRAGIAAYHRDRHDPGTVNAERSRYVLHDTTDPDVFVAEIDAVHDGPDGQPGTMSLVQIFRLRDDRIAALRDYFAASEA